MKRLLVILSLVILILGCGSSMVKRPPRTETAPRIPVALLIERTISGVIGGVPLKTPSAIVTDFRGDSYLCDEGNNRIIKFDTAMQRITDRGGFGNQPGLFNRPRAMAIDNQLNLWICDAGNRRLVRLDGQLNFVDEVPFTDDTDPLKFGEPSGIAVTSYGSLWVADLERDQAVVFDNVGQFEKFVGDFGASGGQLKDPQGVATDGDNFYVCDGGNSRVMVYDQYGSDLQRLTDDEMILPVAVALDRFGVAWVLDKAGNRVFCFDIEGRNLAPGGVQLVGRSTESMVPAGISCLSDSTMLLSDAANGQLFLCKLIFK
jgi:DNA-binding beta-propeller fold protein YncE